MNIRIHPKKNNPKIACMPLVRNVPEGHDGWKKTKCPVCGSACWYTPLVEMKRELEQTKAYCTMCAFANN